MFLNTEFAASARKRNAAKMSTLRSASPLSVPPWTASTIVFVAPRTINGEVSARIALTVAVSKTPR